MPNLQLLQRLFARTVFVAAAALTAGGLSLGAQDAGTGTLFGKVVSWDTGETIPGALVTIDGTGLMGRTDLNGFYFIRGVPPGAYKVSATKDGYRPSSVTGIRIEAGEGTRSDLPLESSLEAANGETLVMEEFVVESEVLADSDLGLLGSRQKAAAVSDAIGTEGFSQFGISDAAEAMSKVTGASVVDGKYVVIRGLGDRYTSTTLNNVTVPTADPDRRAVQLDQFPAEMLESVVTSKSFTPDQGGAFSGGSINLRTRSLPDRFFARASAKIKYQTGVTGEDILSVPGGGRDWTGFDDGTRALPADFPDPMPDELNRAAARQAARRGDFGPAEELDRVSKLFHNETFFPSGKTAGPSGGFSVSLGDRLTLGEESAWGYIASFNYDSGFRHYTAGTSSRYSQGSVDIHSPNFVQIGRVFSPDTSLYTFKPILDSDPEIPGGEPAWGVTASSKQVDWGAFGQIGFMPSANHEITLRAFFNQSAEDRVKRGVGEAVRSDSGEFRETYDLLYTERSVSSLQLTGKSVMPAWHDATLEWRLAYSDSTQSQPDYRTYEFKWSFIFDEYDPSGIVNNRYFRDLSEDNLEAGIDLTVPLTFAGNSLTLKFGGMFADGGRVNTERAFVIEQGGAVTRESIENFPNPVGIISRTEDSVQFGTTMREISSNLNYTGDQQIGGAYLMGDWANSTGWRVVGGLRAEYTEMVTRPIPGASSANARPGEIRQTDLLPALSLIRSLGDKANVRFAYGRTIARPTFRELADVTVYDAFNDEFLAGNPDLEMSRIHNLDLRWEYYPTGAELFAVSAYFKHIDNPIELAFDRGYIRPQNVGTGRVFGIEFETRRKLGQYAEWLRDFSVGFNASLISSQVNIPEGELAAIRQFDPEAKDTRELYDQSSYTLNASLTYDNLESGTAVTLAFNMVGDRLALVTTGVLPDVYERPAPVLDLVASQRLTRRWTLKFSAENLLDSREEKSLTADGREYLYESYARGRVFTLGLSYSFN
ncbi:MAG: hypothetical protein D6781_10560 [Verrucomicrobia bacterium]|nr:MAG: hypothetical protein D6781_10560 [Verrucomicrobiota bacterium]